MILEQETFEQFGYRTNKLKPKSRKQIIASCDGCGKIRTIQYRSYNDFCHSCSMKGKTPWNKGLKAEDDERVKRSCDAAHEARRGKPAWNKGIPWSDEAKEKMSKSHMGKYFPPAVKKIRKAWNKGIPCPEEMKIKISETLKAKNIKGENHPFYGKHHTEESNEKNRLSHLGKKTSMETKEKLRKKTKANWQKPEFVKKVLGYDRTIPNKPELKLNNLLQQLLPNEYKYVGNGEFVLGGKCPDFLNVNGKKLLIKLYGDYWHRGEDENERIDYFKKFGFNTLIVWEKELKDIEILTNKIIEFNKK